MPRYAVKIHIEAPPQRVYDYLADLPRHAEWASNKITLELIEGSPGAAGARYRSYAKQPLRDVVDILTIVETDPPRHFAFESEGAEGAFRFDFEVAPEANGTRLTRSMQTKRLSRGVSLMLPAFYFFVPWQYRRDLRRIKQRLEAS